MPPATLDACDIAVQRRLRIRAPADVVWDTARAVSTQHIAGFSFLAVELPTVGAPQFLLVRPATDNQCSVDLFELRRASAWTQELVELSHGSRSMSMSLAQRGRSCTLTVDLRFRGTTSGRREQTRWLHQHADAWLHNVALIARGKVQPCRPRLDLVAARRPKAADEVVVTTATRRFPYPRAHLWDRMVAEDRPATGPFVLRLFLTPGPHQVGSITAQVAMVGDRLWPLLYETTELRAPSYLALRRVNGPSATRVEWSLDEVPEGTLVTVTHHGPTAPRDLEETLDALQDLARLPISTGESTR